MDTKRNDAITRSLTVLPSRRDVLPGLAGAGLGLAALLGWPRGESDVAAKKKRKKKHKQQKHKQRHHRGGEAVGGAAPIRSSSSRAWSSTSSVPHP